MMKTLTVVGMLALMGSATLLEAGDESDRPVHVTMPAIKEAGFNRSDFKKLDADEVSVYRAAYPPDVEMLEKLELGSLERNPIDDCIAGEAPTIEVALEKCPLLYPRTGRFAAAKGQFEWIDKMLYFRSETQLYAIVEDHILYRLQQMGVKAKGKEAQAIPATLGGVWRVNEEGDKGLQLWYLERVALTPRGEG